MGKENQQSVQSLTQKEMILQLFINQGLVADKNIKDVRVRETLQKKQQKAFQNTELLLRKYRTIAWMVECFPESIAEELDKPFENVDKVIDRLDLEMAMGNRKVNGRLESMCKTRWIMDRVNEALSILKKKPGDGEQLYDVIYMTYITPEKLNHNDILYRLNLSSSHYYRMRDQAIDIISIRLWSAPSKEIAFWLELISLMGDD